MEYVGNRQCNGHMYSTIYANLERDTQQLSSKIRDFPELIQSVTGLEFRAPRAVLLWKTYAFIPKTMCTNLAVFVFLVRRGLLTKTLVFCVLLCACSCCFANQWLTDWAAPWRQFHKLLLGCLFSSTCWAMWCVVWTMWCVVWNMLPTISRTNQ